MAEGLAFNEIVALLQLLMNSCLAIYAFFATRQRASREEITGIVKRLDVQSERLTKVEIEQRHMPAAKEVSDLRGDIRTLEGSINAVAADLSGMKDISKILRRQMETMDDYLRKVSK